MTTVHKLLCIIVVLLLFLAALVWRSSHPVVIRPHNHLAQLKQVGTALKLYADDNQGRLPNHLEEMIPDYFTQPEILEHVEFLAPGALLPDLPPGAVIARRPFPEDHVTADLHANLQVVAHP